MSEHKSLYAALHGFQSEAPTLPKDATNPHFKSKFTPLDTVVEKIGPLLTKHELVWVTLPSQDESGRPTLKYRLAHSASSETLEGEMPLMVSKGTSQDLGGAITYGRRYAITAVLNLVADEDVDGRAPVDRPSRSEPAAVTQRDPVAVTQPAAERPVSAKQKGLIYGKADEKNLTNTVLANIILAATGNDAREFDSEDAAGEWLKRSMDRLPAARVNAVLAGITSA